VIWLADFNADVFSSGSTGTACKLQTGQTLHINNHNVLSVRVNTRRLATKSFITHLSLLGFVML